jgi:hypothetical protein
VLALRDAPTVQTTALIAPAVRLCSTFASFATMFDQPVTAMEALGDHLTRMFGSHVWTELRQS